MTTTEVETNADDVIEGEVIERLTPKKAQALDKRIRAASDKLVSSGENLLNLLDQAARGEIHEALGVSWTAWFADAVRIIPTDKVERKALVAIMSGKGMSQRAISGVLNVSKGTVQNDQATGQECPPDNVIGLDGRTSSRKRNHKPEPEPVEPEPESPSTATNDAVEVVADSETVEPQPKPPPLIDDFRDGVPQLLNDIAYLLDSTTDERFTRARTAIRKAFIEELLAAECNLKAVIAAVNTAKVK